MHFFFIRLSLLLAILPWHPAAAQISADHQQILDWEAPKELKKMYPYFFSGFDNDGSPIMAFEYGRWDTRATMEKGADSPEVKAFQNYTLQLFVRFYESPTLLNSGTDDYIIVTDLEGFDNRQFSHVPTVAKILEMGRHFFKANRGGTGRLKKVYLVNVNYLFQTVFELARPIIGELATKFENYGTNKEKWIPVLRKNIKSDQIPHFLGGSKDWKPVKIFG